MKETAASEKRQLYVSATDENFRLGTWKTGHSLQCWSIRDSTSFEEKTHLQALNLSSICAAAG